MNHTVYPGSYGGEVNVPASKSLLHRCLIMAALSHGQCRIRNICYSDDVLATIRALEAFGIRVLSYKDEIIVQGGIRKIPSEPINCSASASTLRFMIPWAALCDEAVSFTGSEKLMSRPLDLYQQLFETYETNDGVLTVKGYRHPEIIEMRGDVSSQFFSGLMMVLPLLDHDTVIKVKGRLESYDYVLMTARCLKLGGIDVKVSHRQICIRGRQKYQFHEAFVDGDYSQASYWLALGCLNGPIHVSGFLKNSHQGDRVIIDVIRKSGGQVTEAARGYDVKPYEIGGLQLDCADCPDLVMTLAVMGMFAKEKWVLKNLSRLRYKESDRLAALQQLLTDLGAIIKTDDDTLTITGRRPLLHEVTVDSHNDHRMIMAAAIAATVLEYPVTIKGAENVKKSYPDFFRHLENLRKR